MVTEVYGSVTTSLHYGKLAISCVLVRSSCSLLVIHYNTIRLNSYDPSHLILYFLVLLCDTSNKYITSMQGQEATRRLCDRDKKIDRVTKARKIDCMTEDVTS